MHGRTLLLGFGPLLPWPPRSPTKCAMGIFGREVQAQDSDCGGDVCALQMVHDANQP